MRGFGVRTESRSRLARVFWLTAGLILGLAAIIAIAAVLKGEFSDTDGRILATLGVLFLAGSAALAGLALIERGLLVWVGRAIVSTSPVGFAISVIAIWVRESGDTLSRLSATALLLLAAELVVATNRLLARSSRTLPVFAATSAAVAVATSITLAAIWSDGGGSGFAKATATFWILTALGYFLTPILQRFETPAPAAPRRILAVDGIEAVATREPESAEFVVKAENAHLVVIGPDGRVELGRDEVLVLRPSATKEEALVL